MSAPLPSLSPPGSLWPLLFLFGALATGCSERPQDGLDALIVALQEGDADAAWQRFDQASRTMMRDTAAALRTQGHIEGSAKEHLMSGFAPEVPERIEVASRDGDRARLRVTDLEGKSETVDMRYEEGMWRLHLPGAGPLP